MALQVEKLKEEIIDSNLTLEQAFQGKNIPESIKEQLEIVSVRYYGFDEKIHHGQMVLNKLVARDVQDIFEDLFYMEFPIEKVVPISEYGWEDEKSMKDNNSSSFNYRMIKGTNSPSLHAFGFAVDINPNLNPCYYKDGTVDPEGATYDESVRGTITKEVSELFIKRGWEWGGNWEDPVDYQHFQKRIEIEEGDEEKEV